MGKVELDVRGGEASIDAGVGQAWNIFGTIDVLLFCSSVPGIVPYCSVLEDRIFGIVVLEWFQSWFHLQMLATSVGCNLHGSHFFFRGVIQASHKIA